MANRRNDEWEADYETYSEAQVESILGECKIEIESDSETDFLCYCPFHSNYDSPAFAINKTDGLWLCFNGSCGQKGKLEDLPKRILGLNFFQCKRMILKYKNETYTPLQQRQEERLKKNELPEFRQEVIDEMHNAFWGSPGYQYMVSRGFEDATLKFFQIGWSEKKKLVSVPMYSEEAKPVGVIGRTIPPAEKRFRNSNNLPRKEIPWNIHNARTHGDTLIICEASYDAMRIHQAGYPNVVALLGGFVSPWQHEMIDKTFSKIIIMTDFDKLKYQVNCSKCKKIGYRICNGHNAGRDFGRQIIKMFPNKRVMWAAYDDACVYPHDAKDASDMTDDEIRQCLKNVVSTLQYQQWKIEPQLLR